METFAGNKMKPLSIALAVRGKTGQIIAARVAAMNCHGPLASRALSIYGPRVDTRDRARSNVLRTVGAIARSKLTVATDGSRNKHQQPPQKKGTKPFDPLFRLNHTCAKIRADLARMARRTWATTKRLRALQYHLDIYIAYNNGYEFR